MLTYQAQLNGHVADLTSKTSPEGRKWTFGYTLEGDLEWVVLPAAPFEDGGVIGGEHVMGRESPAGRLPGGA